jgi:hypothetical protein
MSDAYIVLAGGIGTVLEAMLGTSRPLSVSTTTTIGILTGALLAAAAAGGGPAELLAAATTLTVLVGLLLLAASLLRLGAVANLTIMGRAEPPRMMKCRLAPDRSLTPTLSQRARERWCCANFIVMPKRPHVRDPKRARRRHADPCQRPHQGPRLTPS